jgi:manganese/zinc/iron transport system permease protein
MTFPDGAVACACLIAGMLYGLLGSLAYLRRQSLRGDVLAHAAWPGVLVAFLVTGQRSPLILSAGALFFSIVFGALISAIERLFPRLKGDGAPALLLSGSFALGSVLWSLMQRRMEGLGQAGLKSFLLGQAAAVQWPDVWTLLVVLLVAGGTVVLLQRDIASILFDRDHALLQGKPVLAMEWLLDLLLALGVVTGLTIVGMVVLSALLVAIPLAARPFTHRFGPFVLFSTLAGILVGLATPWLVIGLEKSFVHPGRGIPTGPIFVLLATLLAVLCTVLARTSWLGKRPGGTVQP